VTSEISRKYRVHGSFKRGFLEREGWYAAWWNHIGARLRRDVIVAQDKTEGPTCEKAQKTYNEGLGYLHQRTPGSALESFKKADSRTAATAQHVSRR
jgi:hypothetical protein